MQKGWGKYPNRFKTNRGSVRQQVLKFMEDNADKSFSSHDVAAQFPEDVARGVWHATWWLRKSKQCHISHWARHDASNGAYAAYHKFGVGVDAPKPPRSAKSEKNAKYRHPDYVKKKDRPQVVEMRAPRVNSIFNIGDVL